MSGINDLKEKSKKQLEINEKRKIDLSEMIGGQTVGNPSFHKDGNLDNHTTSHKDIQITTQPVKQQNTSTDNNLSGQMQIHTAGNMEIQPTFDAEPFSTNEIAVPPSKQTKNQKIPNYKMTFNIREDIYKAFHALYANRILKGRSTEKSEMICEAIQLLINREKN